ncbi:MAG: VOC family protein [Candidatus Nanopelagicales bacterium]|jgi:predicted 3-demethylubiquinone-9 3-methyltransferase (glyoxalase superfamily)|nr:VOC family protein [Candidatus Nanopelagicales bacterium]
MAVTGLTTFLWFDTETLEAATLYTDLFDDSELGDISTYPEDHPHRPAGSVLSVSFTLFGRPFVALNGGPDFPHSEAVSFMVHCDTQDELDHVWDTLVADGGQESRCGWCKDRFGVSWQVVPSDLQDLLSRGAWPALLPLSRSDISALRAAAN